jgi:hypothetical protein
MCALTSRALPRPPFLTPPSLQRSPRAVCVRADGGYIGSATNLVSAVRDEWTAIVLAWTCGARPHEHCAVRRLSHQPPDVAVFATLPCRCAYLRSWWPAPV